MNKHSTNVKNISGGRQSNFELLRIVCMIGIIASHYVTQSDAIEITTGANLLICLLANIGGKFGVNCFVIITSWFLVDKVQNFKSVLLTWFTVFVYQLSVSILSYVFGIGDSSLFVIAKSALPVLGNLNWYVSAYFVFIMLIPFVKIMLYNLSRLQFITLFITLTIANVIGPYIFEIQDFTTSPLFFIYIFIAVYGVKKYDFLKLKVNTSTFVIVSCIFFMIIMQYVYRVYHVEYSIVFNSTAMYSPFQILLSAAVFTIFKNLNIKNNKLINSIAKHTFSVFVIHTVYPIRYNFLWKNLLHVQNWYYSKYFLLHLIVSVVAIYICCLIVDAFVTKLVFKPVSNNNYFLKFANYIHSRFYIQIDR